ncbi:MAG: TIGR03087 family PEP-CTERM/XrtA system glycosyltransferase [Rubrivivax sp.]|nr:TIGR03087 family PEP-CTERM/XrtA system glycosyltransferase [Rubrivivax sp.]
MARILYLVHRLPFPPNKGDKVRSYHLLRHLAEKHEVYLGTFVDDPEDEAHVATLRQWCKQLHVARLYPRRARIASLTGLWRDEPLTLAYYRDAGLDLWVRRLRDSGSIDAVVVFSSSMAQYAHGFTAPVLVDFVDVDSAKWTEYAGAHRWPMSWLYRREGRQLLAYERLVAARSEQSFFVTEKEALLFRTLAPECAQRVNWLGNGVDADYFSPDAARPSPFARDEVPVVFTGAMDYWPNVDAVTWFVQAMLPALCRRNPALRLYIVGRNPPPAVKALAGEQVLVTGTVPDVRPYLQHAAVVVAPLRLARGVQNKVLEAMAMARPVVAARPCVEALDVQAGKDVIAAFSAEEYVRSVEMLLDDPSRAEAIGRAARERVLAVYGWSAQLAALDRWLCAADARTCAA